MTRKAFMNFLLIMLMPIMSLAIEGDREREYERLEKYHEKLKGDSLIISLNLDSAQMYYELKDYGSAIKYSLRAYEHSKIVPESEYEVQSILLLARSYRNLYARHENNQIFQYTLKYYLKAITNLESAGSRRMLPKIYKEYGDFYLEQNLVELTLKNYDKALDIVTKNADYAFQKELLTLTAALSLEMGNQEEAIRRYARIRAIHQLLGNRSRRLK